MNFYNFWNQILLKVLDYIFCVRRSFLKSSKSEFWFLLQDKIGI